MKLGRMRCGQRFPSRAAWLSGRIEVVAIGDQLRPAAYAVTVEGNLHIPDEVAKRACRDSAVVARDGATLNVPDTRHLHTANRELGNAAANTLVDIYRGHSPTG
jgi:hypothetical protein